MDKKIFKYVLPVEGEVSLKMPEGAQILTVQTQGDSPCLWALVDPDGSVPEVRRDFRIFGPGHSIDIDLPADSYIGTFQLVGGRFIGHMFEV